MTAPAGQGAAGGDGGYPGNQAGLAQHHPHCQGRPQALRGDLLCCLPRKQLSSIHLWPQVSNFGWQDQHAHQGVCHKACTCDAHPWYTQQSYASEGFLGDNTEAAGDAQGYYFTGDGCKRSADGMYTITGRVDDVINVSGHRVGTAEVEAALASHGACIEAAVVG